MHSVYRKRERRVARAGHGSIMYDATRIIRSPRTRSSQMLIAFLEYLSLALRIPRYFTRAFLTRFITYCIYLSFERLDNYDDILYRVANYPDFNRDYIRFSLKKLFSSLIRCLVDKSNRTRAHYMSSF